MDDKHIINCNDVPEIDMTRQDGGLEQSEQREIPFWRKSADL